MSMVFPFFFIRMHGVTRTSWTRRYLPKSDISAVEHSVILPDTLTAPLRAGEAVGTVTYTCKGETLGVVAVTATKTVERITWRELWGRVLKAMFGL